MQQYAPRGFRILPPVVKNLLIINGLMFLATLSFAEAFQLDLIRILGLHYLSAPDFRPYQFVSYMFMHGGVTHILFNMFALWMFGNALENVWGGKRFLIFYFFTGIGAGLTYMVWIHFELQPVLILLDHFIEQPDMEKLQMIIQNHSFYVNSDSGDIWQSYQQFSRQYDLLAYGAYDRFAILQQGVDFMQEYRNHYLNLHVVVGASGAVYGILLAFGMMFPNTLIYLYFAIPIKAKYVVIAFGALELVSGISNRPGDNVAHFAHLGGMLFGYILLMIWKRRRGYFRP